MIPPRWGFGHLVALVELGCGVVGAGWLIGLGVATEAAGPTGRTPLDRSLPFLLALAVGAGLIGLAVRSWRAANREARQPRPTAATTAPASTAPASTAAAAARPDRVAPTPLSSEAEREVARIVEVLAAAGVFAPEAPDPGQLGEAVADRGEPVTAEGVLGAVAEADWYRPDFDASRYSANLAFHDSHGEQFAATLREQAEDIMRLAGLTGVAVVVELGDLDGPVPTTIRLTVDGIERSHEYLGAVKYLSTVLHVELARILRGRATGRRLAWLWNDQGVWLSALRVGEVERLGAALGPAAGEGWEWVDEQPPTAAGDPYPSPAP